MGLLCFPYAFLGCHTPPQQVADKEASDTMEPELGFFCFALGTFKLPCPAVISDPSWTTWKICWETHPLVTCLGKIYGSRGHQNKNELFRHVCICIYIYAYYIYIIYIYIISMQVIYCRFPRSGGFTIQENQQWDLFIPLARGCSQHSKYNMGEKMETFMEVK